MYRRWIFAAFVMFLLNFSASAGEVLEVIPIDLGRQLFVDDFLIEHTTLKRTYHRPKYHPANPVLKPDRPWEQADAARAAAPFSDGVFYDPQDKLFKIWYISGYIAGTSLATSRDGIHWDKPDFGVRPGTNEVLSHRDVTATGDGRHRDSSTTRTQPDDTKCSSRPPSRQDGVWP